MKKNYILLHHYIRYILCVVSLSSHFFCDAASLQNIVLVNSASKINAHIDFLKKIHTSYAKTYPIQDNHKSEVVQPPFIHPAVIRCAKKIGSHKSLEPLFAMWKEFDIYKGYDLLDDELFLQDCCRLLCIIYTNMLCYISGYCATDTDYKSFRTDWGQVRDFYVLIASLPLAKFVILLDKIVVGLTAAIADNADQADGSILGWVRKNWWIPPIMIAGIITSLVLGKEGIARENKQDLL